MGCTTATEGNWITSQSDGTHIWLADADPTLTYRWEGSCFDSVAHGDGILYVMQNGSIIDEHHYNAHYGALDENAIVSISDKEYYVGELIDGKFNGYGVYNKAGEIYIGHFKDSKPDGLLSWYRNGKPYYVGMWTDGKFHGEGTLYKEDGTIKSGDWEYGSLVQTYVDIQLENGHYEGYVKNNKPDGNGAMTYSNGSVYYGKWKDGKWNGQGTYETSDSITISSVWLDGIADNHTTISTPSLSYEGGYFEGCPHGLCKIEIPNLYSYFGYMGDGVKSGYGEFSFDNGDNYKGDWYDNLFDGEGVYVYSNQHAKYDGQWYQGLQDGIGYYQCPEFAYRGEWEDGWINGYGKMVFSNKDQYIGSFVEDQFYGDGSYIFSNGNQYDGEFVEGKFNGLGTFYFNNGDIYTGEFKDGNICGDGSLTFYENGDPIIITANWPGNNKFPSQGSVLFPNGDIYEGELIDGVPTTKGKWTSVSIITKNQNWADSTADYYNNHIEEIQKIRTGLKYVATGLGVATIVVTGGTAGIVIGIAATVTGIASTATEVGCSSISAYDEYRNTDNDSIRSQIISQAGMNLGLELGSSIFKVKVKGLNRLGKIKLSKGIKMIGKASDVKISNKNVFGKIVTVTLNNGTYEKKLLTTSKQNLKSIKAKPTPKKIISSTLTGLKAYRSLQRQKARQAIVLTEVELNSLKYTPKTIRACIKKYTGNQNAFEEFFIRLALGDKNQATELLNIPYICYFVDRSIRLAGKRNNNEYLMGQTFRNFITDPKWGKDSQVLVLLQIQLTKQLSRAILENEKHKTSSVAQISSDIDRLNDQLARELYSCSGKDDAVSKATALAKRNLSSTQYEEFEKRIKKILSSIEE